MMPRISNYDRSSRKRRLIMMERPSVRTLVALTAASALVVIGSALTGIYAIESPFVRGIAEEFVRLLFIYASFRLFHLVATPSVVLSLTEAFFATVVNGILFKPDYLVQFSYSFIIAMCNIASLVVIGFIAAIVYFRRVARKELMITGLFVMIPTKITFYVVSGWLERAHVTVLIQCLLAVGVLAFLTALAWLIWRRSVTEIDV